MTSTNLLISGRSFCPGVGDEAEAEATRFAINSGMGRIKTELLYLLREGVAISWHLEGDWVVTSVDRETGTTQRPGVMVEVTNIVKIREMDL